MTSPTDRLPRSIASSVAALCALPVLADLLLSDRRRVFGYLAADAFYYLTVARNLATSGRSTFDGEHLTNGYHPLWQALTGVLHAALGEPAVLFGVVLTGLLLVTGAAYATLRCIPDGPWARILAPSIVLGPTAAALIPLWLHLGPEGVLAQSWQGRGRPLPATLWAAMNGMETGLVLVGFALAMMLLVRLDTTTRRGAAALGASLALMTLARLDHGLLAVGVLVPVAVGMRRSRSALLAGAASFSLPITTYLAANKLVFGHALPVSGRLKSTFPEISTSFFDAVGRVAGGALPTFWLPWAVRLSLIIIPCVLALVWLATEAVRKDKTPFDRALTGASLGALGLAAYDILFVPLQHQGHWYFPVNTLVASLVVVRLPDALGARVSASAAFRSVLQATCFVVVCGTFAFQRTPHNLHLAEFYHDVAPALRQHYEVPPRLVSYDDGIVAYATGFPTLSGLGFTLDGEAVDAASEGRLLELAWDRGYRHVTSLVYFPPWFMGPAVEKNIDAITSAWPVGRGGEAPPFSFSIDYRTDDGEFVIFRIASLPDPG